MDKMTGKDKMSSLSAVLGIVLGVLATVLMFNIVNKHNKLNANYAAWQKLNLILQQVDKNYVDTVDVKKVTDAAVTAALASLDPHSIYIRLSIWRNPRLSLPGISTASASSSMSRTTRP